MSAGKQEDQVVIKRAVESAIKIAALAAVAVWCFQILSPFVAVIVWGGLIAVIAKPLNDRLEIWVRGRGRASTIMTLALLVIFIAPSVVLVEQATIATHELVKKVEEGTLELPDPPQSLNDFPLIGSKVYSAWSEAADNVEVTLQKNKSSVNDLVKSLLGKVAGAGITLLMLVVSIIISGFFLSGADGTSAFTKKFIVRLAGPRGAHFATQASTTVRNVARGIIGVAVLQASLAWLGFYLIELPAAPLLAGAVLMLSIVQINPLILMIPTALYVFSYEPSTIIASIYLVWSIAVGLLDNILKPLVMGKGSDVPIMVIFLGAVGGFVAHGFAGLFVGAVVMVVGYELFITWLNDSGSTEGMGDASAQTASDGAKA